MMMTTIDEGASALAKQTLRSSLDRVRAAIDMVEASMLAVPDVTEQDLAEAYRSLISNFAATAQRVFTGFDLNNPRFVPMISDFWRGVWSNPDSHICNAEVVPEGEYRITGEIGNCADLNIEVLWAIGGYDDVPFGQGQVDSISKQAIKTDLSGRFEIFVGGEPRPENWLRSPSRAGSIFVRQTLAHWDAPPSPLVIERLNPVQDLSDPRLPQPAGVAEMLDQLAKRFPERYTATGNIIAGFKQKLPVNDVVLPSTGQAGLLPTQYNCMSQFDLAPGTALVIETEVVITDYQSIAIGHYHWFEAFDPRYVQASLTIQQSEISSDGLYRFVLSAEDPGVANWLDTAGHRQGFFMMRWQGLDGARPGKPAVRLIQVSDVRSVFPEDTPAISSKERAARQRKRRQSIYRRFP